MSVVGINLAEVLLKPIDIVKRKFAATERLHAPHDLHKPAASLLAFVAKKEQSPPIFQDRLFWPHRAVPNEEDSR